MSDLPLDNPNPTSFPASFDAAVLDGGYRSGDGCWNAYVNRDLILIFDEDAWLPRQTIVERYAIAMQNRLARYHGMPDEPRTWADAGNVIHHGLALGLVAEETGPAGDRGWRLLDAEPNWIVTGTGRQRECRQVRGLPATEQDAVDRAEATRRKLNATLDRKAREKADDRIDRAVRDILRADPASVVPAIWARRGCVPQWLPGTRLDAAAQVVREAHHAMEMGRPALKVWISDLAMEAVIALGRPRRQQAERDALPAAIEIPADDADALEVLL